ncbi:MAG: malonate transporter [Enterovirga sp.]|nr:malonate transporter [Enterovirga sp.]
MTDPVGLFNLLFPFFGVIALGFGFARIAKVPEGGLAWMQLFLIYVALPCLFFRLIGDKPIDELANWRFIAATTLSTAIAFGLSFLTGRLSGLRPSETVLGAVAGSYSNVGYMGPPMVLGLLGPAASTPVALIFIFDTVFLFSATPGLMALAGVERRSVLATAGDVGRKILTHPFVIATIVAILASTYRLRPPVALDTMIGWLSGASAPCALFLLGVTVALRPVGRVPRDVAILVAIKLVVHPLVVWLVLAGLGGFDPVWIEAAIVMAALPPALNIFVLARQYGAGIERASACVLVGTVASIATLTAFILLTQSGALPLNPFR